MHKLYRTDWNESSIEDLTEMFNSVTALMKFDLTEARKSLLEQESFLRDLAVVITAKKLCKSD